MRQQDQQSKEAVIEDAVCELRRFRGVYRINEIVKNSKFGTTRHASESAG